MEVGFKFQAIICEWKLTCISVVVNASCDSVYGKMVLQTKNPFLKGEDA